MLIFDALEAAKIKISIVNYTNTLPFKWALKNSSLVDNIILEEDIPSICAQKLKFKQVDIALVPVALIPELDTYFIETDYCIGANGKVDSVKLYSSVPLEEINTVVLDYQSKTSVALIQVLFKFYWKRHVEYVEAKPGYESEIANNIAAVVIGDRTFALNGRFEYEYDLAEVWKSFTGLPFVFAVWISVEKLNKQFISEFNAVLKNGLAKIKQAVNESEKNLGTKSEEVIYYLTKRIDYTLDESKMQALELFLSYFLQLKVVSNNHP